MMPIAAPTPTTMATISPPVKSLSLSSLFAESANELSFGEGADDGAADGAEDGAEDGLDVGAGDGGLDGALDGAGDGAPEGAVAVAVVIVMKAGAVASQMRCSRHAQESALSALSERR